MLRVLQREWLESSVLYSMQNAIDTILPLYPNILECATCDLPSQHEIHMELMDREKDTYAFDLMCTRLLRFFPDTLDCQKNVTYIISKYNIIVKSHLHTVVLAHLRALLNQWSTQHRYGKVGVCLFCRELEDRLEHVVVCPKVHRLLALAMNQRVLRPSIETLLLFKHQGFDVSLPLVRYCMIWLCVAFNCHNACRHVSFFSIKLVRFQLKRLASRCNNTRKDINWFRSTTLNLPTNGDLASPIVLPNR